MMGTQPDLAEGELEVEIIHHDELAFHANDYKWTYWLKPGEQVLRKKERGRLAANNGFGFCVPVNLPPHLD